MTDVPLLERLAALPPVPISELIGIMAEPERLSRDPLFAGLVGVDESGARAVHPLVPAVLERLGQRADATCYGALIEALTGILNAAVRVAVVAPLRAAGLPPDHLLLRLEKLSPTLGFQSDDREWARGWVSDPTGHDAALVQQCMVRLLLGLRGLAEARARVLIGAADAPPPSKGGG